MLTLIAAAADDRAIGKGNDLPWRLPDDLKFFKKHTLGKPMIMGRKTWESLGEKALPGRTSAVVSTKQLALPEGVLLFSSLDAAIAHFAPEPETMIVGGGQIFAEAMPKADCILYTQVQTTVPDAGAYFPEIHKGDWEKVWEEAHPADERHLYAFTFQRWERRRS